MTNSLKIDMKTLKELVKEAELRNKEYLSFEDYCQTYSIDNPILEDELKYIDFDRPLNPIDTEYSSYEWKTIEIYERLGVSLSPHFIYDKLSAKFPELKDFYIVNARDENVVLQFKAKEGFKNNPKFKELLNYTNWYINLIEQDRKSDLSIFSIEPKLADNATSFIYGDCSSI